MAPVGSTNLKLCFSSEIFYNFCWFPILSAIHRLTRATSELMGRGERISSAVGLYAV
jgi:hypothetical protein